MFIQSLCIKKDRRGKGLGRILTENAMATCPQAGQQLSLDVYKDQPIAIHLYESLGFVPSPYPRAVDGDFATFNKIFMVYKMSTPASPKAP